MIDTLTLTMPAEDVYNLYAGDASSAGNRTDVRVRDAGPILERWHETWNDTHSRSQPWWSGHRDSGHETWSAYVDSLAEVLRDSDAWPFPPIYVSADHTWLYDGHHRTQAALRAGWDKPIPVQHR